ncbi:hypothetical protein COOONC_06869, partial [Cooperia oncophora]
MPVMDEEQQNKTGVKLTKKVIKTPADPRNRLMMQYKNDMLSKMWTMEPSVFGMLQMAKNMTSIAANQCEALFNDDALIQRLHDEKFDVGITETIMICGLGIFELLKINASIAVRSIAYAESLSKSIGGMATNGDRMNIFQRFKNMIGAVLGEIFYNNILESEIEAFRAKFGPQFKGSQELLAGVSYIFTNSNPYLDFPRPMLHKTIPIGGIAIDIDPENNILSKVFFI